MEVDTFNFPLEAKRAKLHHFPQGEWSTRGADARAPLSDITNVKQGVPTRKRTSGGDMVCQYSMFNQNCGCCMLLG